MAICDCERGHNGFGITGRECDCQPAPREVAGFALRMVVERIGFRIDVMEERGLPGVSISKGFAQEIVRACQRGSELLENPEPAQAGLTADSGNGSANVSEGVTGGGERAVGDAAGEAGGHLQPPPTDNPAARIPCAIAGPSLLRPAETCPPGRITTRQSARQLKCPGVGRDKDNICALQFYFSRPVTDDEIRFLHDVMKRAVACMPRPDTAGPA